MHLKAVSAALAFQMIIDRSSEPEARAWPLGDHLRVRTALECLVSVPMHWPRVSGHSRSWETFHNLIVESIEPVARRGRVGWRSRQKIPLRLPLSSVWQIQRGFAMSIGPLGLGGGVWEVRVGLGLR